MSRRSPKRTLATALLVLLTPAAHAFADAPSLAESLVIADRWAATAAPGHVNHCSGGRLNIETKPELGTVEDGRPIWGLANGWVLNAAATAYEWDHARCAVTIRADLTPEHKCWTIAHELMHYVIGPEHVGPLDPRHPGAVQCYAQPALVVRVRRSRAQIVRSLRFRRIQAKIRARALARATRYR